MNRVDAFYVGTPDWKEKVVRQALQAMQQAVKGLYFA